MYAQWGPTDNLMVFVSREVDVGLRSFDCTSQECTLAAIDDTGRTLISNLGLLAPNPEHLTSQIIASSPAELDSSAPPQTERLSVQLERIEVSQAGQTVYVEVAASAGAYAAVICREVQPEMSDCDVTNARPTSEVGPGLYAVTLMIPNPCQDCSLVVADVSDFGRRSVSNLDTVMRDS